MRSWALDGAQTSARRVGELCSCGRRLTTVLPHPTANARRARLVASPATERQREGALRMPHFVMVEGEVDGRACLRAHACGCARPPAPQPEYWPFDLKWRDAARWGGHRTALCHVATGAAFALCGQKLCRIQKNAVTVYRTIDGNRTIVCIVIRTECKPHCIMTKRRD